MSQQNDESAPITRGLDLEQGELAVVRIWLPDEAELLAHTQHLVVLAMDLPHDHTRIYREAVCDRELEQLAGEPMPAVPVRHAENDEVPSQLDRFDCRDAHESEVI